MRLCGLSHGLELAALVVTDEEEKAVFLKVWRRALSCSFFIFPEPSLCGGGEAVAAPFPSALPEPGAQCRLRRRQRSRCRADLLFCIAASIASAWAKTAANRARLAILAMVRGSDMIKRTRRWTGKCSRRNAKGQK
jgi:hypothetical protein